MSSMDLIKDYQHEKNFEKFNKYRENILNKESFDYFCLYHSATTPFQKHIAKIHYLPKHMIEMNDIKTFKEILTINHEIDITYLLIDCTDEMFNLLIKNFNRFYINYVNLILITQFSLSRLEIILNTNELMKYVHKSRWFFNLMKYALKNLDLDLLNFLILRGEKIDPNDIVIEVMNDNISWVSKIIPFIDLNIKYEFALKNCYLLEFAIDSNSVGMFRLLINNGANANFIPKSKKIKNKLIQYMINISCDRFKAISRKLPDDFECPIMYIKIRYYHLCTLSDKHIVSVEGFTEMCPFCRVHPMDLTIYENRSIDK